MKTIGERIAELRREKGLTQEALGETIGVSAQTVSKWENSNTAPDISLLPVLADVFGTSIDGLFGREGRRKDVSFEEFPELCFDALLKTYAECWCSGSEDKTSPADMIRAIRENGQTNSGVAADSGASVLLWRDFACVSHEKDEDVLPLLDKDLFDDFFATLARPSFRHIVRVLIETESPADKLQPPAFTSASLAKKCGLSVEETERELTALGRYGFVQIMEQTVDMDEALLKVYSRWGRGSARLFLYPLILLADRFLTNRNHWRGFRG